MENLDTGAFMANILIQLNKLKGEEYVKEYLARFKGQRMMAAWGFNMVKQDLPELSKEEKLSLFSESGKYLEEKKDRIQWCQALRFFNAVK